nr:DUF2199 domain-containing protein [Rhizobiaceae bacterium]
MSVGDFYEYRWTCKCCGEEQAGLPMDMSFSSPHNWPSSSFFERLFSKKDSDLCKIWRKGEQNEHYVRSVMRFPVLGENAVFSFGVWISVSEKNWLAYRQDFKSGAFGIETCFGYLMHEIPGFEDTWAMHCEVEFQDSGFRPLIFLHEADHPLY